MNELRKLPTEQKGKTNCACAFDRQVEDESGDVLRIVRETITVDLVKSTVRAIKTRGWKRVLQDGLEQVSK